MTNNNISFNDDTKEFIYFTEAVNQIFAAADCTEEIRSYVDFLIGASKGRFEFTSSDEEVSRRAISKRQRTIVGAKKWLQRKREMLEDWQTTHGIKFVGYVVGSQNFVRGIKYKTEYRLHILKHAEIVIEEAKNDGEAWEQYPFLAIENAAKNLVERLKANQPYIIQKKAYKRRESKYVNTKIHNLMRGMSGLQQLIIDGREITDEDIKLFKLLEAGFKNIKSKIEDAEKEGEETT